MNKIIIALIIISILQTFARYKYLKYYNTKIKTLYKKYNSGYFGIGIDKRKFFNKTIFVLIIDKYENILEAQVLKGISIFSKFKELDSIKGCNLSDIKSKKEYEKYKIAIDSAYDQIRDIK
ncbi:hypothetical protein HV819_06290 [Anaerococcus sp. AGMB00486]|uniref:Transcriptional regulator n=2 Tax=Anaerococcus TaxID=165779 RepID=A0ABX2NAB4_9FIRM|nr:MULTISPECIES: transcriptional regulator GutM [Anaerococcus]MSS77738.1 hypothetical protein [Anaerococcus porci]NVF11593.1 hypothetical protein [Anaerococcus faecalis]